MPSIVDRFDFDRFRDTLPRYCRDYAARTLEKKSFGLIRNALSGVVVVTFDELLARLQSELLR